MLHLKSIDRHLLVRYLNRYSVSELAVSSLRVRTAAYFKGDLLNETNKVRSIVIDARSIVFGVRFGTGQEPALGRDSGLCTSRWHATTTWQLQGRVARNRSRVQVNFVRDGKTVATVPGTLKTNDAQVTQDDIVTDTTSANTKTLKEIDFSRTRKR